MSKRELKEYHSHMKQFISSWIFVNSGNGDVSDTVAVHNLGLLPFFISYKVMRIGVKIRDGVGFKVRIRVKVWISDIILR